MEAQQRRVTRAVSGRVLTVPNAVTFLRLLGVPLFLYLLLLEHQVGAATAVLVAGGASDWLDGYLARRMRQVSRLGEILDPITDRLYIVATVLALTITGVLPWFLTVALMGRELVMGVCLLVLRHHGHGVLPVHFLGKTSTFALLCSFPLLLLAEASSSAEPFAAPCGWALVWWGIVLYWIAAGFYIAQARDVIRGTGL